MFGGSVWVEHQADDGAAYFFNTETKETVWDRPEGLDDKAAKPDFIKEIEANARKRVQSEKAKEKGASGKAPKVGATLTFELPMTEADLRANNKRDRERREKLRTERCKREGKSTQYMTPAERERDGKKQTRKEQRAEKEDTLMARLREQADKRKARQAEDTEPKVLVALCFFLYSLELARVSWKLTAAARSE